MLLPTRESVEEVVQESRVVKLRKLSQLDVAANFLTWAKMIARFEALRQP